MSHLSTPMEYMGLAPQHSQQPTPSLEAQDRARAYKSRNKRPCDFCRYKKAACHLDVSPPCELCARYGKECTFVESPPKRRRFNEEQRNNLDSSGQLPFAGVGMGYNSNSEMLHWDQPPNQHAFYPPLPGDMSFNDVPYDPTMMFEHFDTTNPGLVHPASISRSTSTEETNARLHDPSLDNSTSSNAQIAGFSGEREPYFLRQYKYDQNNDCSFLGLRLRRVGESNGIPVHFVIQQNKLATKAHPAETQEVLDAWRGDMREMVSDDVGRRLIKLFFQYIQPYFPVLSRERSMKDGDYDPCQFSTCLLATVYAHALPFCVFDEQLCVEVYTPPSAEALYDLAWKAAPTGFHTPSLSIVQALLLMVLRRPTNKYVADTPTKNVLISACLSIAQALGLNLDPTTWSLPSWEQRLRKRLAWTVYTQEKWVSLTIGRSSHFHKDDWDLVPLQTSDFEEFDDDSKTLVPDHFLKLCKLTEIVDDILREMFSVKALRKLSTSYEATMDTAKPLTARLSHWYQSLPPSLSVTQLSNKKHELNSHGALHLAHITARVELFRAMMRPKVVEGVSPSAGALRNGAMAVAKDALSFLESLDASHLEAFWPSYSRTALAITNNFLLSVFATSPNIGDARECMQLLNAWRGLLRIRSRSSDLLNLALLRVDNAYANGFDRVIDLSPAALEAYEEQVSK